ncbi:hypothetical protein GDO81_012982 [Engystomops pustulosus]|uniref:Cilia- and flagella-associated protein 69 ARM repeats domain-containing protein n=1 Tax=Engystomops pustulosus TaxID=76066 RepID=A0AAV7AW58_ENGPU|nr:hypothetical protein GDO81_012982 [Engystomops pustulosus]
MMRILQICASRIEDFMEFIDPVCDIIKLLGLPFLKNKMSDEARYTETAAKSLSHLGDLMYVPSPQVRMQICSTVMDIYNTKHPIPQIIGFELTSTSYNVEIAAMSGLAETLVSSLTLMKDNVQVKILLLRALQLLSRTNENCMFMARGQAAFNICSLLNDPDPSGELMLLSSGIILNLLDLGPKDEIIKQMNNLECICALKDCVVRLFTTGYTDRERQLRNDLLVITTVIAEKSRALMINLTFLLFLSVKSRNPLLGNIQLLHNREGLKMKRLLMDLLVIFSKDWSSDKILSDKKVVSALFTYVIPTEKPEIQDWPMPYFQELQLQAISTLSSVAPRLVEHYMACEGNKRLLQFLKWCSSQDGFVGNGNGCCRRSKNEQICRTLKLLNRMVSVQDTTLNKDLCDQGAVRQLLRVLKKTNTDAVGKNNTVILEIQTEILSVLTSLCETDSHTKELFGSQGVDVMIQILKMGPTQVSSGLGHERLILSTLTCVWSCITGYNITEDDFLDKQGMFLLLDLLAVNWKTMNTILLTLLNKFLENPKTHSHFYTWRGKKFETVPHLLIQLWNEAEKKLGEVTDKYGRIIDPKNPLGRQIGKDQKKPPISPNNVTTSTCEVAENNKSQIYSLFLKLGFSDLPGLSTLDYVTLIAIMRHLDFQVGKVWNKTRQELKAENIQPLKYDSDASNYIKKEFEDLAKRVRAQQSQVIVEHQKMELEEEQRRYAAIKASMKQRAEAKKTWDNFVLRTSNYDALKEAKRIKEDMIELSRPEYVIQKGIDHATEIYGLNTTVSCGRVLRVQSTPSELTGGPLADTCLAQKRLPIRGGALRDFRIQRFKF